MTSISPVVSVPVLSLQSTSMLPKSSMAARWRTMTCLRPMRIAPCASVTVVIIGKNSGVRPTASATAKSSVSSPGRCRSAPASRTKSTRNTTVRMISVAKRRIPRSNSVSGGRSIRRAAMSPKAARREPDDVAGHHLAPRALDPRAVAPHGRPGPDLLAQTLGGPARAIGLREVEDDAQPHHDHDDGRVDAVADDGRDEARHEEEDHDQRIGEKSEQLDQHGAAPTARGLVRTDRRQPPAGLSRGEAAGHFPRTVRTGHGAVPTTRSATLPRKTRASPMRPWVPITIMSA